MASGYKHFSHKHNLMMHEMPEGAEVSCSGCNSSATKTIYICWQCNFYLHEQCFQATRSRKHPSHPQHPLTLVPYPTYPSNSFYCNYCKIIGTGFSYSCSDCDFDLHVQCAYSISSATNFHQPHPVTNPHPHHISYPNQEIVSMVPNVPSISFPTPIPIPAPAQYSINITQDSYMAQNVPTFSIPTSAQNPVPSISFPTPIPIPAPTLVPVPAQYPINITQDSYMAQNVSTFSVPTSAQNPVPSVSFPNPIPVPALTPAPTQIPTPVPVPAQYPINITQDSYMAQNASTFSVPTSAQNPVSSVYPIPVPAPALTPTPIPTPVPAQYPINITQDSYMAQNALTFSVPTSAQNPITSAQNAYQSQSFTSVPTSVHNSSIPQNTPLAFVPSSAPNSQPSHGESGQNKTQNLGIKHFSHPHSLVMVNIKHGKKKIACSGCQETLIGKGYACVEQNCGFQLDESCFNLDKEIQHKSHPPHHLNLLSSSPYKNTNGKFTCNACFKDGTGFNYHCSICEHDLHVKCANLKETVKRDDHEHVLKLFYECPLMGEEYTFFCDVCNRVVHRDHWTYYCKECDFGTHLDCVDREVCDETSGDDPVVDARSDQQRVEESNEYARISAIGRQNALDNI
ncbi:hypothetical protein L1987_56822 [Smallanthus sonchifolius]|uniref:Uncharacterized protein n=1 Tax=Smallanthus sonchifolius TaxID=185202 RepID=A0ACB9DBV9_9ASTR|nr:hypothetical protein L1987_56822 [Smallanthus sonchifolius]